MADILGQKMETELSTQLGKIKVKVPSLPKRLEIERRRTSYAGGFVTLSYLGADLAEMFAFLDVVMIECEQLKRKENDAGSWDYDVLTEFDDVKIKDAYDQAVKWLDSFRKGVQGK